MRTLAFCAAVGLFLTSALSSEEKEPPNELVVDVLELPASCDAKAATGDKISMHYVRCFRSNGVYNISLLQSGDRRALCF